MSSSNKHGRHGHGHDHDHEHDHDHGCDGCPEVYDYIVVGAGTAGAPLAKYLSDDHDVSVLLLEGGHDCRNDPLVLSNNPFPLYANPAYHWFYPSDTSPIPPNPGRATEYIEGKCVGGSSAHNFLLNVRPTPCVLDEWAAFDKQWSYRNMLPIMKGLETYTPTVTGVFNSEQRGECGPLFITQTAPTYGTQSPISPTDPIVQALGRLGAPYSPDYNDPTRGPFSTADFQTYIHPTTLQRSWAGSAFLGPDVVEADEDGDLVGVDGRQLLVDTNAAAIRVLFDDEVDERCWSVTDRRNEHRRGKDARHHRDPRVPEGKALVPVEERAVCDCEARLRARGIEYVADGETRHAIARRKVILSAGAIQTPAILIRSGIGPAGAVANIGVELRLESPHVGTNFENHIGPSARLPLADPTQPPQAFQSVFPGPESRSDGCRDWQGLFFVNNTAFDPTAAGVLQVAAFFLRPRRAGTITPTSATDPDAITIDFDFYSHPEDVAAAVRILKTLGNLSIQTTNPPRLPILPPPAAYPASEYAAFGGLAPDDSALAAYAIANSIVTNHTSGSARMSDSIEDGVVDADLDVHCVANLGIADNSVVPRINDGNTSHTAYIVGIKKAEIEGATVRRGNRDCDDDDDHDHKCRETPRKDRRGHDHHGCRSCGHDGHGH